MWSDDSGSALRASTYPTRVRRPLAEWDDEEYGQSSPMNDDMSDCSSAAMIQIPGAALLHDGYPPQSFTDHFGDGSDDVVSTLIQPTSSRDYFSFDNGLSSTSSHSHWNVRPASIQDPFVWPITTPPPMAMARPSLSHSASIRRGNVDPRMSPVHRPSLRGDQRKTLQVDAPPSQSVYPENDLDSAEIGVQLCQTPWTNQSAVTLNDAEDYSRRMLVDHFDRT